MRSTKALVASKTGARDSVTRTAKTSSPLSSVSGRADQTSRERSHLALFGRRRMVVSDQVQEPVGEQEPHFGEQLAMA